MHHPEQGTPLWPDYLFSCLVLPHKSEDRKKIREEHQSQARSARCDTASTDLPWQNAQGHRAAGHTQPADTPWVLIHPSALFCILFLCFSASLPSHTISRADPQIWLRIWSLPVSATLYQQLCCDPVSSASAPGTACWAHSCKKPFPAWYSPTTPPAQSHPGPLRRRESFLWARQGVKPWERLGAESQLRGRSGFTSKTWVTSSFKGGSVPWSQQFHPLSPSGRLTWAASGICNQQKGTKMSNLTNSYLHWKIN